MSKYDEIERKLKDEVESSVPDVFDKILDGIKNNDSSENVLSFEKPRKKHTAFRVISSVAAALVIIVAASYFRILAPVGATYDIEFDVNPGVILEVNKKEKVVGVTTLNSDAQIVLDGMDLTGSNLNVAINALMFSIIKNGYIDEMTNSVLVTVSENDIVSQTDISDKIANQISSAFEESSLQGSVLVQSADKNSETQQLAAKYGITIGKAVLIKHLVESEKTAFTYDVLSKLSINELNILMNEKNASDNITVIGQASRKAYIGDDAAKKIAYQSFKINSSDVLKTECELDIDDGCLVYEISFETSNAKYECDIDALTGAIYNTEIESHDPSNTETTVTEPVTNPVTLKSKEEVKQFILGLNSVSPEQCKNFQIELDYDDNAAIYEVEFEVGDAEYEYEINAVDCTIVSTRINHHNEPTEQTTAKQPDSTTTSVLTTEKTEKEETTESPTEVTSSQAEKYIGSEKAKSIAIAHSKLNVSDCKKIEIELDHHKGKVIYEVEIKCNGIEYEYKIDAVTGDILSVEKDHD